MAQARPFTLYRSLTTEPDDVECVHPPRAVVILNPRVFSAEELRPVPLSDSPFISGSPVSKPVLSSSDQYIVSSPSGDGSGMTAYVDEKPLPDAAEAERESRRPPEWLVSGIFFDLA